MRGRALDKGKAIKITICVVAFTGAAVFGGMHLLRGDGLKAAADQVTIKCSETGETWTEERGRLIDQMYTMKSPIDPSVGLPSPAAKGKPVAFPEDRKLWERLVKQVNDEKAALKDYKPGG